MAILASLRSATFHTTGERPDAFFGSGDHTAEEMAELSNEVAETILQHHDWQRLTKLHNFAPNGTDTFPMPADYSRQLVNADIMQNQTRAWGYEHIQDINEFLLRKRSGVMLSPGAWIIYGGEMHFAPAPTEESSFPYISSHFARGVDGITKAAFTEDTDEFLLPERLLTLGLIWKWNAQKGLIKGDEQADFEIALGQYATKDAGSKIIRFGRSMPRGAIFPWVIR